MSSVIRSLVLVVGLVVALASVARAEEERIGLVLSGGGARGVAHVGVLKKLEELQVPVHAIAGTSMGALVGGLYATGLSSEDLEVLLANIQWDEAFRDAPERRDLPQRRKSDSYDFPVKLQVAIKDGKVRFPLGLVQGQQVTQMIKDMMLRAEQIDDFDEFPIPYRAVAADVATGDAYVFSEGDVVLAMRTSMSLPGFFAPVEHDGRLLVDGGIANNLPVNVARAMGVDRLIVIDIGTPLAGQDELNSVLSVTSQMMTLLTRKNTEDQLRTLTDKDVLITPELSDISTLDFPKYELAMQRGYAAADALEDTLAQFAVNDEAWNKYVADKQLPIPGPPTIDFVQIENDSNIDNRIISVRLSQQIGEPLDREQLEEDIRDIYGLNYFETIDYQIVDRDGETGLVLKTKEKSWGVDNLKFGLNLLNDLDGDSRFNMGVSYRQKGMNSLGGELFVRGQIGDTIILDGEFYQPIGIKSAFFVSPYLGYKDHDVFAFREDTRLGNWRVRRVLGEFDGGVNLFENSEFRVGLFRAVGDYRVESGELFLNKAGFNEGGYQARYTYDNIDSVFFPTQGGFFMTGYEGNKTRIGSDTDFGRFQVQAIGAFSFGKSEQNTFIFKANTRQSINESFEPQNFYQLGGLFNLSGFAQDILSGTNSMFAMAQYQYRITKQSLIPFDAPVYVGMSLEKGNVWDDRAAVEWGDTLFAGSIYLAIDSPVGPIYLAYGRAPENNQAVYFSLGWPFNLESMR